MKTAAIFTFQWSDNYGTVFQALAMQEVLSKAGLQARIVPLRPRTLTGIKRYVGRTPRLTMRRLYERFLSGNDSRHEAFEPFRRHHFKYAFKRTLDFAEASQYQYPFDFLVFGSDNIWSGEVVPPDSDSGRVFFATGIEHSCKVAYAASCCGNLLESPMREAVVKAVGAGGFSAISCREATSVAALRAFGLSAEVVPDPTLLLEPDDWLPFIESRPGKKYGQVWGYDLGHSQGLPVLTVCERLAPRDEIAFCSPNSWRTSPVRPTPGEWLAQMEHASCVVTNSFHGVVFSVIFRRPFLFVPVVGPKAAINCRAISLLQRLGLEGRMLKEPTSARSQIAMPIDWRSVLDRLASFRGEGLAYIDKVFSGGYKYVCKS